MKLIYAVVAGSLSVGAAAMAQGVSVQAGGGQSEVRTMGVGGISGSSSTGGLSTNITIGPDGQLRGNTSLGPGFQNHGAEVRVGDGVAQSSSDVNCPGGMVRRDSDRSPDGRTSSSSVSCDAPGGGSSSFSSSGSTSGSADSGVTTGAYGAPSSSSSSSSSGSGRR